MILYRPHPMFRRVGNRLDVWEMTVAAAAARLLTIHMTLEIERRPTFMALCRLLGGGSELQFIEVSTV